MPRQRPLLAVMIAGAMAITLSACAVPRTGQARNPLCAELARKVGAFDGVIEWDNGMTKSEANWHTVLRDGAAHGTWANRKELAEAVRADAGGYQRLLATVPEAERLYFDTLHARMAAPQLEQVAVDPAAAQASNVIAQLAAVRCNLA